MDIICTNDTCAEYLILKPLTIPGVAPSEVTCGFCGQPMAEDDGRGVPDDERPNPDEPLPIPGEDA